MEKVKKKKAEAPKPMRCVCGSEVCIVKSRGKKMLSCPDPMNCRANLRTLWHSTEESAIIEWNGLVESFYSKNRNKGGKTNEQDYI